MTYLRVALINEKILTEYDYSGETYFKAKIIETE